MSTLPEIKGRQAREGKRIAPKPSNKLLVLTLGDEILLFNTEPFQLECRLEFGVVPRWLFCGRGQHCAEVAALCSGNLCSELLPCDTENCFEVVIL